MTPQHPPGSRRAALKQLLAGVGALAVWPHAAHGAEPPHLAEQDPQAVKLGYVEDAKRVDKKKFPAFEPAQSCENCLQLQGADGAAYRPCQLFPGKAVAVKGWCSGWTAEI